MSAFVGPDDKVKQIGTVFGTPLTLHQRRWVPLFELVVWPVMTWWAGKRKPERSWGERIGVGALTTTVLLGSEWCHNFAHAAAASLTGKRMDMLCIYWGTPLVVYHEEESEDVTPRQHIIRSLGGPLFNGVLMLLARLLRPLTRPGSAARDAADVAVGMNTFLCTGSLVPIPEMDGGPLIKWTLVRHGLAPEAADEAVRDAGKVAGVGLGVAAGAALKRRSWLVGGVTAALAAVTLGVGFGLIKPQE